MARREQSLKVEVPRPGQDRPELGRVGVIAAVGFVVGVAWPWLAGVRLVPRPPTDDVAEHAAAPSASATPGGTPAPDASAARPKPEPAEARTTEETLKVSPMQITGCRDAGDKKKLKNCDSIAIDDKVRPLLSALSGCSAAHGATETLSIGLELDFDDKSVKDVFPGKSTTFPKERAHALVDCARAHLSSVNLDGIVHEHARYTVFYFVAFVPPGTVVADDGAGASAKSAEETAPASGMATVSWDVAIVRDRPEKGKIVARIRYGTRVIVTARRGNWYEVKYDAKGGKGWVHRNALGL